MTTESKIIEALELINNPYTDNLQRKNAHEYCSLVMNSNDIDLGSRLVNMNYNLNTRYYGLSMILNSIKTANGYNENIKITVSNLLLHCSAADSKFIKTKITTLFVELIKRIWPLDWIDMDSLLYSLYQSIETRPLPLMIYKSLMEDIFILEDPIALKKKGALVNSLMAVSLDPEFLQQHFPENDEKEMLLKTIRAGPDNPGWLARVCIGIQELCSLPNHQLSNQRDLFSLYLDTLNVFLTWVPFACAEKLHIVYMLKQLLNLSIGIDLKCIAVEALQNLYARHIPFETIEFRKTLVFDPVFVNGLLDDLITMYNSLHQCNNGQIIIFQSQFAVPEEDYKLLKQMTILIKSIIEVHVCAKRNLDTVPVGFERIIEFLLSTICHPSTIISLYATESLCTLFKHEFMKTVLCQPSYLEVILPRLVKSIKDGKNVIDKSTVFEHYALMDFDSVEDAQPTCRDVIQLRLAAIRQITTIQPVMAYNFIDQQIRLYFSGKPLEYGIF